MSKERIHITPASHIKSEAQKWNVLESREKLIRYLSRGGIGAFARTSEEEARDEKQNRFLLTFAIITVIWICMIIF